VRLWGQKMANGDTTVTTPVAGGLNYADYQKKIQEAAAKTRNVQGFDPATEAHLNRALGYESTYHGGFGQAAANTGAALISNFKQQQQGVQQQANKAANALEMVGSSTLQGMQNLEAIQGTIRQTVQSASDSWGAAAEKADEYVKAARGRVTEVLGKLDEINQKIGTDRDFAKAHTMQAAVQGVMGSMKNEERNIVENYGTNSKEYAQFMQSKRTTLATVQSNIQANYAQLQEQQGQTYLNVMNDAYTKSNMYLGFQEQQHVEMLKFRDEQRNAYAMQGAQLDIGIEQMKMAGMENLANWIVETPTFTMDATSLITAVGDLVSTSEAQWASYKIAKDAAKQGLDWGGLAGQAIGTGVGAMAGGLGAGVGGAVGKSIGRSLTGGSTKKTTPKSAISSTDYATR